LEHMARRSSLVEPYPFPFVTGELDFRPLLRSMVQDRGAAAMLGKWLEPFTGESPWVCTMH
ncbi:MAG TPA: hypothetical protein VF772_06375, partial [Terriglobales bacterium]